MFEFLTGSSNNTIKNCNISTGTITSGANGIYASASGVNNLVIDNNVITKTYYGVNVNGVSGGVNYNNQITNNIIGSATDVEAVAYRAVAITYSDNMLISNNELKGAPAGASAYYQCGVYVGTGSTNTKIKRILFMISIIPEPALWYYGSGMLLMLRRLRKFITTLFII